MEEEIPRVSNEGSNCEELNLNEKIRVSSGCDFGVSKCENDEIRVLSDESRVLGDFNANGGSGEVDGVPVFSARYGIDEGGGIVVEEENSELGKVEVSENETCKLESSEISGTEKSREVEMGENDMGLSGIDDENKVEESQMDDMDSDFKLVSRGSSKRFIGFDIDDSVMRSVSAKVLGTQFEMGDMVWGKVKSHPWWPGHLYNEAFASSSVRRTRRGGHILIAFFGDSSYGWFDPEDLVPYDPHYAEKSQQALSRNFVRAVEESVDESSRRSALGLSCYCRNPLNFRPTNVPGYLAVDIVDFEPSTVYSVSQIQKARDSFRPPETLSFIHQLATMPMCSDSKNIDFVKNKATTLAYRRSIFEEFDETYAEAFGDKPERPPVPKSSTVKEPSLAPLSGPLVFADTLGVQKSSTKKPKEQSKKDRYLFKRRDESNDLSTATITQGHSNLSSPAHEDGTSNSATAGYVFKKRDQSASNNELGIVGNSPALEQLATSAHAVTSEDTLPGHVFTSVPQRSKLDEPGTADDVRTTSDKFISIVNSSDAGNLATSGSLLKKKKKAAKRPASEMSSGKPEPQKKRAKKLRTAEEFGSSEHPDRHSAVSGGESPINPVGPLKQAAASTRDDTQVNHVEATDSIPRQLELVPLAIDWENEADVRQILADLLGLALNPVHGLERNGPAIARQFLLKFRSLNFSKSSCASATSESEQGEARFARSPGPEAADRPPSETSKTVSFSKKPKVSSRRDDSAKVGLKRVPSERQEENAAKRAKKITDVKSLSAEKRTQLKNSEMKRSDGKSKTASAQSIQSKPVKVDQHEKKFERPPKVEEPTYLVMKYPPGSTLPSLMELKARFTRFGPLDISLNRVFYKTNTCRVTFLYKQDANVAYRYAVGSKTLFSNVRFMLKPVAGPESQPPSSGKTDNLHVEPGYDPYLSTIESRPTTRPILSALPQPMQPLKSCLKKPDESGGPINGGGSSRTARVRFNMGEEKSSGSNRAGLQVPLMESRNPLLSTNEGPSSSIAMDVNNSQRLLSSLPLQAPLLPLPTFVRPPINHHSPIASRNNFHEHLTTTTASLPGVSQVLPPPPPPLPPPPSSDVTQQMMNLLTKCHDVVTNVQSILGYVPYHPL